MVCCDTRQDSYWSFCRYEKDKTVHGSACVCKLRLFGEDSESEYVAEGE